MERRGPGWSRPKQSYANTCRATSEPQAGHSGVFLKANVLFKKLRDPPLNSFLRKYWKLCRPLGSRISSLKLKAHRSTRILVGNSTLQGPQFVNAPDTQAAARGPACGEGASAPANLREPPGPGHDPTLPSSVPAQTSRVTPCLENAASDTSPGPRLRIWPPQRGEGGPQQRASR